MKNKMTELEPTNKEQSTQQAEVDTVELQSRILSHYRKIRPVYKKGLLVIGVLASLFLMGSKWKEHHQSLGHETGCPFFELRKEILYVKQWLNLKTSQWEEGHFLNPVVDVVDQWLDGWNESLIEKDEEHTGDQMLEYATQELEDWHYAEEGGDTVFSSEIMEGDPKATPGLWSVYSASLHGLNGWDFSIHVIHVTEQIVQDVNQMILEVLPKEGQVLIDAISTHGFSADSFYLEGRRVDLTVHEWGIEFLFYLPTKDNPLE